MNKKYIYIGIFFLVVAIISIFAYVNLNSPPYCYDCGQGGWDLIDTKCDSEILSKEDAISCLSKFEWSNVNLDTNPNEVKEAFIKLHDSGFVEEEKNSIKVYNYHQWAIDEEGNMYLEGQLG